jgi:transcriptional regulator with XRE-family HTH domain
MVNRDEIKRRRKALKLTQTDAGVSAGWGKTGFVRWSRLERGTPKDPAISTIEAVANVLGCTVNDLLAPPPRRAGKRRTKG